MRLRPHAKAPAPFNVHCQVDTIKSFNLELLARRLWQSRDKADGIAFMALEHPAVREAVDRLEERGVPTVTLISDILNARRAAYVGLDNRARIRGDGLRGIRGIRQVSRISPRSPADRTLLS